MPDLINPLTPSARSLPESGIVKVFNYGRTREGLIALWAGEGDTPTGGADPRGRENGARRRADLLYLSARHTPAP